MVNTPSSPLHWVGGKKDIAAAVTTPYPHRMNAFHDVFLGGGSILLHVLTHHRVRKAFAYDSNPDLIQFFEVLRSAPRDLAASTNELQARFNRTRTEDARVRMYNRLRARFNRASRSIESESNAILRAATFLFLNKTAFGGLFRTNARGEFNAAYGRPALPLVLSDEAHLCRVSHVIRNVRFVHCDFRTALESVGPRDFVYCDPPYLPFGDDAPSCYRRYSSKRFSAEDRDALLAALRVAPYFFVLSNVDQERALAEYFPTDRFEIRVVPNRRRIKGNAPVRETVTYPTRTRNSARG